MLSLLFSCSRNTSTEDAVIAARVPVKVSAMKRGIVSDELTLFASTLYLKRNVVTAPIPAFITQVFIKLGDQVKAGQILYLLETKERRALGSQSIAADSSLLSFGKITIKASASGIISTLDKQQIGDYILEGSQLCTIAESGVLAFSVNVPYEYIRYVKAGSKGFVVMPDNSRHAITFTTPLTTMNVLAQTQTILAKANQTMILPENLIVKILVNRNAEARQQVLPKACVLSDEMMENFWVMKLVNDSTAVKVVVTPGVGNRDSVEIKSPLFSPTDQFLVAGNYGLPDTARVMVEKN